MQAFSYFEGRPGQMVYTQHPSTSPGYPLSPEGQRDYRNPIVCQPPSATQHSSTTPKNGQYSSYTDQMANGYYWKASPTNGNYVPLQPAPYATWQQAQLRNQVLKPSISYASPSRTQYPQPQTPIRANSLSALDGTLLSNKVANPQRVAVSVEDQHCYVSQEAMHLPRPGIVPQLAVSHNWENYGVKQSCLQRILNEGQGMVAHSPMQSSLPVAQGGDHHHLHGYSSCSLQGRGQEPAMSPRTSAVTGQNVPMLKLDSHIRDMLSNAGMGGNQADTVEVTKTHSSPRTRKGQAGKAGRQDNRVGMANQAPKKPGKSSGQYHNTGYSHQPNVRTSTDILSRQPHYQVQHEGTVGKSAPWLERNSLSVTTVCTSLPGNAHTAVNELVMASQPANHQPANHQPANHQLANHQPANHQPANHQLANHQPANHQPANHQLANHQLANHQPANHQPAQHKSSQISSADRSVEMDNKTANGGISGIKDPQNHSTQTSITPSTGHVVNPPQVSSQQDKSSSTSSSQKAVAVVSPLSPHSSDHEEPGSIVNAVHDLPFKILSVRSLREEATANMAFGSPLDSSGAGDKETHILPEALTGSRLQQEARLQALKTSGSEGSSISVAPGAEAVTRMDEQVLCRQKSYQSTPSTLPNPPAKVTICAQTFQGNLKRNGGSEKDVFDLSSVAITEWTTAALLRLIAQFEQDDTPLKQEMDVEKTAMLYEDLWQYRNHPDVFSSDLYKSIMSDVHSVCGEGVDKNTVVFSQIQPTSLQTVRKSCHILQHRSISLHDTTLRPSLVSVEAQIGKAGKEEMAATADKRDKMNVPIPDTQPKDESPISATGDNSVDPFSSIQVKVLSVEDAEWFFTGQLRVDIKVDESQNVNLSAGDCVENQKGQAEAETPKQLKDEEEENQVPAYCCPFRWIEVTTGYKDSGFCKCQCKEESSKREAEEGGMDVSLGKEKGENTKEREQDAQPMESSTGHVSAQVNIPETKEEDPPMENKACLVAEDSCKVETKPAGNFPQDVPKGIEEEAAELCSKVEEGACTQGPPEYQSLEELLYPSEVVTTVSELGDVDFYSGYEEVLVMSAAASESSWSGCISKQPQSISQENTDGTPAKLISMDETVNVRAGPFDISDLKSAIGKKNSLSLRHRVHKRLPSKEKQDNNDEVVRGSKAEYKSERRGKSSELPVQGRSPEYLPQKTKTRERKRSPCSLQSIPAIKKSKLESEKSKCGKRKSDVDQASLKSKLLKLDEGKNLGLPRDRSEGKNRQILSKENFSKELPEKKKKKKKKAKHVRFALYGSSSKDEKGTLSSNSSHGDKRQVLLSKKNSTKPAKQQVYSDWERSFVPIKSYGKWDGEKEFRTQECTLQQGALTPGTNSTVCGNQSKQSKDQTKPQPHRSASTVKPQGGITHQVKSQKEKVACKLGTKDLDKKNMKPKAGTKVQDTGEERKRQECKAEEKKREKKWNSVDKAAEQKLISKFSQHPTKDSPSIKKAGKERRPKDLKKATLPLKGAGLEKLKPWETKDLKKVERKPQHCLCEAKAKKRDQQKITEGQKREGTNSRVQSLSTSLPSKTFWITQKKRHLC